MMSKMFFYICHAVLKPKVLIFYYQLKKNEYCSTDELLSKQNQAVLNYLKFCQREIPFYFDRLDGIGDKVSEQGLQIALNQVGLLNKSDIKAGHTLQLDKRKIGRYKIGQTGGSTGDPLRYRISETCANAALALLYRGLSRGGYRLGDKMAVIAGGSLVTKRQTIKTRFLSLMMNIRKYSSYGVGDDIFEAYFQDLCQWKPKFLRGYASSIYEFARFVERKNYRIHFVSVFTTAEMLLDHQRSLIEQVFCTKVYDGYGLNDGGVSAFECSEHQGFHVDLERAYLEVVDENGQQIYEELGRIVATSYLNKATPFVRYLTGDLGIVSRGKCSCGSPYPLLKSIKGRTTDTLEINGRIIGGPVLTVLMAKIKALRYQFIQTNENQVLVVIDKEIGYSDSDEEFIQSSLYSNLGEFDLRFSYDINDFVMTCGGKHKFVIDQRSI